MEQNNQGYTTGGFLFSKLVKDDFSDFLYKTTIGCSSSSLFKYSTLNKCFCTGTSGFSQFMFNLLGMNPSRFIDLAFHNGIKSLRNCLQTLLAYCEKTGERTKKTNIIGKSRVSKNNLSLADLRLDINNVFDSMCTNSIFSKELKYNNTYNDIVYYSAKWNVSIKKDVDAAKKLIGLCMVPYLQASFREGFLVLNSIDRVVDICYPGLTKCVFVVDQRYINAADYSDMKALCILSLFFPVFSTTGMDLRNFFSEGYVPSVIDVEGFSLNNFSTQPLSKTFKVEQTNDVVSQLFLEGMRSEFFTHEFMLLTQREPPHVLNRTLFGK